MRSRWKTCFPRRIARLPFATWIRRGSNGLVLLIARFVIHPKIDIRIGFPDSPIAGEKNFFGRAQPGGPPGERRGSQDQTPGGEKKREICLNVVFADGSIEFVAELMDERMIGLVSRDDQALETLAADHLPKVF